MYLQHFGLRELPFSLTPDTQFFLNSTSHHKALNLLLLALEGAEGFIKITGEVGTGKTLLCRKLLNTLDKEKYITAYIPNPGLSADALVVAFAEELDVRIPWGMAKHRLMADITEKLLAIAEDNKSVVLLIDEAQAMPEQTLEGLRLLTNLETEKRKLLQVVLFGQPELNEVLDKYSMRQLKQRITFSYQVKPLDREGVNEYVTHRLLTAGYNGPALFSAKAIDLLFRATCGIPRLINILSHKALLAAYGKGQRSVGAVHIRAAIKDTEGVMMLRDTQTISPLKSVILATLACILGVAGGLAWAYFQGLIK